MQDNIPGAIYRKYAEAHLSAAAYSDPVSVVNQLYKSIFPRKNNTFTKLNSLSPITRMLWRKWPICKSLKSGRR